MRGRVEIFENGKLVQKGSNRIRNLGDLIIQAMQDHNIFVCIEPKFEVAGHTEPHVDNHGANGGGILIQANDGTQYTTQMTTTPPSDGLVTFQGEFQNNTGSDINVDQLLLGKVHTNSGFDQLWCTYGVGDYIISPLATVNISWDVLIEEF